MKNIYFIDYENVGPKGLNGIEKLTASDEVYFFHFVGTGDIKYENLHNLAVSKAKTQIIRLSTHDKNAMDFQIVAMLGLLVGKYEEKAIYNIVSNDKGYLSAIECLRNTISDKLKIQTISAIIPCEDPVEAELRNTLAGTCSPKIINRVVVAFKNTHSLQEFHETLQKNVTRDFDSIYRSVKPIYKTYLAGAA